MNSKSHSKNTKNMGKSRPTSGLIMTQPIGRRMLTSNSKFELKEKQKHMKHF
jgi:hypothetical protein